jgi:hypothetical protein
LAKIAENHDPNRDHRGEFLKGILEPTEKFAPNQTGTRLANDGI